MLSKRRKRELRQLEPEHLKRTFLPSFTVVDQETSPLTDGSGRGLAWLFFKVFRYLQFPLREESNKFGNWDTSLPTAPQSISVRLAEISVLPKNRLLRNILREKVGLDDLQQQIKQ